MIFVFPGQGSQKIGMGKDVYDAFSCAKKVFQEIDDAVSFKLSDLIFNGTEEDLKATENSQPALFAVSMMFVKVLQNEFGIDIVQKAKFIAGHSLGEYTALCCDGVLSLSDAAKILKIRGREMSEAFPKNGGMAAILGLSMEKVKELVAQHPQDPKNENFLQIANDNCEGQIVVSGYRKAIDKIIEEAMTAGAKRALPLEVSGPFHSKLMEPAVTPLKEALEAVKFADPIKLIISNVTAQAETNNFRELLIEQLTHTVRWRESIAYAEQNGVRKCVEIGSGKVLTGLAKRISPAMQTFNVNSLESLKEFGKFSE